MTPGGGSAAVGAGGAGDPLADLELLLKARYGLVVLETDEEGRAGSLLRHLADAVDLPLFTWTRTKGLRRDGLESAVYGSTDPSKALAHVEASGFPAIYHFRGLGAYLEDDVVGQRLADAARSYADLAGALVLTGGKLALPESVGALAARLRLPAPGVAEYADLLDRLVRDLRERGRVRVELVDEDRARLLERLHGLTLLEAEKVLTRVIVEDGRLGPEDLDEVLEAKRDLVERDGLLEYRPSGAGLDEVADLAALRAWLEERKAFFHDPARARSFGLPAPRGILLLGVPGCGKSLSARAVAGSWTLPLLKLDPSRLYNKFVGETERNFRRATEMAERLAPVVLWIDEIEKAFAAAGEGDGGVSMRVLGSFLSWLQDREGDVFVVATANDVSRLPPELLRKGRFDEIFFVDLPDREARRAVLALHLARRDRDPKAFDLEALAEATEGFSGSELEQVIVAGLYASFSDGESLTTGRILEEANRTRPLSRVMAEKVAGLRSWARGRTVPAN
ncbi:MAG: AAA family ATPase [Candidatus Palauibacterales bacterium]|nr:AAA family ATPase [Candidatus Palauibacterales bacterium]MDP2583808.1 AAA family ATPase [Candidatus Palauibacterales bacterium]